MPVMASAIPWTNSLEDEKSYKGRPITFSDILYHANRTSFLETEAQLAPHNV